jgi:hypothetical protein
MQPALVFQGTGQPMHLIAFESAVSATPSIARFDLLGSKLRDKLLIEQFFLH